MFFFFMENSIKKKKHVLFILCLGTDYQVSVICEVNPVIFTYFFLWSNMFFCPLTDDNEDATVNKIA